MSYKMVKKLLPDKMIQSIRKVRRERFEARKKSLPLLTEDMLTRVFVNDLELKQGDVVFVHSSIDQLHLGFPFFRILALLRQIVGAAGTVVFPTYPKSLSYDFLVQNEIFDVKKTPSYMGILTEFARKQKEAVRSLHPTKSVCAIGKYATELTDTHHQSPYPYDDCSPYYKMIEYDGKIVGVGVDTSILSFVHCIDDKLKDQFPVEPYHESLFHAQVVDYSGNTQIVDTFAHDMKKMNHNIPRFVASYVQKDICRDLTIHGSKFYTAHSRPLFEAMSKLAEQHITIYSKKVYKRYEK